MTNIFSISANAIVEKLKNGDISCVDLCKAYIERIDKFEKNVKAWAFFDKKLLLEKAEEKDEYRKRDVEFTDFGTRLRPDLQMSFCFKDKVLHRSDKKSSRLFKAKKTFSYGTRITTKRFVHKTFCRSTNTI